MTSEELTDDWLRHITGWPFAHRTPDHLGVAVSGGGDSMACLDLMRWHGADLGFRISAVTVDHGLRAEAADEIALVAEYCAGHGIEHSVRSWSWDGTGNLQAAARDARYRLIAGWALERGIDQVALGHTQDDVAETFLMRLARASGVDGLAAMEQEFKREGIGWVRPLLSHGREDWRVYLKRHGVPWADDPSNEDERFDRVKARRVLSTLEPLGIDAEVLARVAHNLWQARTALDHYVRQEARNFVVEESGDLILPTEFPDQDHTIAPEIVFRLRREALRWVGGETYSVRADAMSDAVDAMRNGKPHTLSGCLLTPIEGEKHWQTRWRIAREFNAVKDLSTPTDVVWDGRWSLDGPHAPDLEIRALGEAVKDTPWRETHVPRLSLMASPAVWRGKTLVSAPVAGLSNGWSASATGRGTFAQFLLSR